MVRNNWTYQEAQQGAKEFLKTVAIVVEAAGTFDHAIKLGLIGGNETALMGSGIRDAIPPSRGGDNSDPDAEVKWDDLLATALIERGLESLSDAEAMVSLVSMLDQNDLPVLGVVEELDG